MYMSCIYMYMYVGIQRSPKNMARSTVMCYIVFVFNLRGLLRYDIHRTNYLQTYTVTQRILLLHSSSLLCSCVVDRTQAHTLWKSWVPSTDPVARNGETKPTKPMCYSMCRMHTFYPEKVDLWTFFGEGKDHLWKEYYKLGLRTGLWGIYTPFTA